MISLVLLKSSQLWIHLLIYYLSILLIKLHLVHLISDVLGNDSSIVDLCVFQENISHTSIYLPLLLVARAFHDLNFLDLDDLTVPLYSQ